MTDETDKVVKLDAKRKAGPEDARTLSKKWGKDTMDANYTVIPSALLRGQARLRIGPNELAVLIHLIDHWWQPEAMPWPSKKTIADRLGVSDKTVQRAMVNLEQAGLITRKERYHKTGGRTSNEYDLSPLVAKLKPIARDIVKAAEDSRAMKKAAVRPGLKKRAAPAASA
jgi:predicted transcriptional regulator